jgi:hypothetical protein
VPAFIEGALSGPVVEATARLSFEAGNVEIEVRPL